MKLLEKCALKSNSKGFFFTLGFYATGLKPPPPPQILEECRVKTLALPIFYIQSITLAEKAQVLYNNNMNGLYC